MDKLERISAEQSVAGFIKEFWKYRRLVAVFAWRDLKVRYSQTSLGLLWAIVQPSATIFILWLVFSRFVKVDMGDVPSLPLVASGVAIWTYFSFVALQSGQSIIQAQNMVKKIYFPKIVLPISKAVLGLVDLVVVLIILLVISAINGVEFNARVLLIPLVISALLVLSLGIGIWISALSIKNRDLQHVFPFVMQLGIYITPVAYPSKVVFDYLPDWATVLYYLNPVAGLIDVFRYLLFDGQTLGAYWPYSLASGLVLSICGVLFFKVTERKIADLI